ncbi:hypothetical protein Tco_0926641 [Tanacetum coccineum]|uniref:Uncharacterized protein n=1 Tax=Tanacetum coccineum TaxID=301880 RepID=A0ABQ5DB68_9ASTR
MTPINEILTNRESERDDETNSTSISSSSPPHRHRSPYHISPSSNVQSHPTPSSPPSAGIVDRVRLLRVLHRHPPPVCLKIRLRNIISDSSNWVRHPQLRLVLSTDLISSVMLRTLKHNSEVVPLRLLRAGDPMSDRSSNGLETSVCVTPDYPESLTLLNQKFK